MSNNIYSSGLRNVGSYQVSGEPFVTGSTITSGQEEKIEFPKVSNNVTVRLDNPNNSLKVDNLFYWRNELEIIYAGQTRIDTNTYASYPKSNGFVFLAFKLYDRGPDDEDASYDLYVNGARYGGITKNVTRTTTATGGGIVIGGSVGDLDGPVIFRDVILWDAALSGGEILALYQASSSYGDPAFSVANKLCWMKPTKIVQNNPPSLKNYGDPTYGNFIPVSYNSGTDTNQIVSNSPFTNSGSLRVHYRSTGSLPNVETNNHYWTLSSQNEQITMNVKSKEIYLSSDGGDVDYSLHADLTNIPTSSMYQHTGSGVDE